MRGEMRMRTRGSGDDDHRIGAQAPRSGPSRAKWVAIQ